MWFYSILILSVFFILFPLWKQHCVLEILQNIGFSVFAAYVFYFVTFFIPKVIKRKQAVKFLCSPMRDIVSYMEKIISVFNKFIKITRDNRIVFVGNLNPDRNTISYFKIGNLLYSENVVFFIEYFVSLLKNRVEDMVMNKYFYNLDEKTVDNILELKSSSFLQHICMDFNFRQNDNASVRFEKVYKDFRKFLKIYMFLSKVKKLPFAHDMTTEERKHCDMTIDQIKISLKDKQIPKNIVVIILNNVCYIPDKRVR